jgi:two-component system, cell cycle sensor histidine kinase and response regulator CckA
LRLTTNEFRHRARVLREIDGDLRVLGDRGRLTQVFVQLLLNAVEALPEGQAAAHRVAVRARRDGSRVLVELQDTGRGIAPDALGRVFDPFYTTKPLGEGTGLGLTLCHSHVVSTGGEISLESRLGEGTTVRVILPAAAEEAAPPPVPSVATVGRLRLLVVDDEPAIARSLSQALNGHEVTLASSGREAIELLGRGRSFDAIVCDLIMSDRTGMDVYQACREREDGLETRILFVTGGAFTAGARDFLAVTANPWLEKPFDLRAFRTLVEQIATR